MRCGSSSISLTSPRTLNDVSALALNIRTRPVWCTSLQVEFTWISICCTSIGCTYKKLLNKCNPNLQTSDAKLESQEQGTRLFTSIAPNQRGRQKGLHSCTVVIAPFTYYCFWSQHQRLSCSSSAIMFEGRYRPSTWPSWPSARVLSSSLGFLRNLSPKRALHEFKLRYPSIEWRHPSAENIHL